MVRNISKGTTQIVKIHIGDKSKKEEPKKKRTYKRKPKKPFGGTGNNPVIGQPFLGSPPMLPLPPMPPIQRAGWGFEPPQQIRRAEEPAIQRIENQQINIAPSRQIRDYVAQMLEQANPRLEYQPEVRIEEVPEPKVRIEEPPAPIEVPPAPLVSSLPAVPESSTKESKKKKPIVAPAQARVVLIDEEDEQPVRVHATKTVEELRSLRDNGIITADYLNKYNVKTAKAGDMTLLQLASRLGISVPRALQNSKEALVYHILGNL